MKEEGKIHRHRNVQRETRSGDRFRTFRRSGVVIRISSKGTSRLTTGQRTQTRFPITLPTSSRTRAGGEPKWKNEPLYIPDRDTHQWQRTHPLEQNRWTTNKNRRTNGHYVNIVRLVKWWWTTAHPELEYPKSYPLEHLVGDCCPDDVGSLAQGFTLVLEEMVSRYSAYAASRGGTFRPRPRGSRTQRPEAAVSE